jgi:hypothetical protein
MGKIYSETVNEIMINYFNKLSPPGIFSTQDMIKYFQDNYPQIKPATIAAHLAKFSTNTKTHAYYTHSHNKGNFDWLFKENDNMYRLYDKTKDPTPIYWIDPAKLGVVIDPTKPDVDVTDPMNGREFAYEKDLQNFLVKNLQIIEPGLKLFEEEDIIGIEYPAGDGRRIDILAVDKNNALVIIELKVSKGYDRVIGQLLRYIGWIEKNLAEEGQKVRGIIICKEISEDLLLASSKIKDVELFEYDLSIKLRKK